MRFILWASFEELLWQSHRQWKRNPSQAELNPQICCGLSVSSLQCTMCSLYSLSHFQPHKLRHFLCLDIPFIIYMSQVVRLEGKHDCRGNRDFEALKGLAPFTYTVKLIKSWVHWPSYLTYFWPFGVILGPCGLFWIISDKIWFFNPNHFAKKHFVFVRQKIKFSLKWSKRVQMGPEWTQMVKNMLYWSFRVILERQKNGQKWQDFGQNRAIMAGSWHDRYFFLSV